MNEDKQNWQHSRVGEANNRNLLLNTHAKVCMRPIGVGIVRETIVYSTREYS